MPPIVRGPQSILARTLILNLLLVAGTGVVIGAIFLLTLREIVNQQLTQRVTAVASYLVNQAEFAILVGDHMELDQLARGVMANGEGLFVVITDEEGTTVSQARPGFPTRLIPTYVPAPSQPGAVVEVHAAQSGAPPYIEVRQTVHRPDSSKLLGMETARSRTPTIGAVAIGLSLEEETAATASATRRALVAAAAWLGLVLVFQFRHLRGILEPLRSLAGFTAQIGEGNLDHRIEVTGSGEIAEVAAAFNRMLDRLAATLVSKETAEQANLAKSDLANTGHELRTPLNAIIGYSELLEEECAEQGLTTLVPDLHKIRNSGRMLLELMNDLLDYSRMEQGRTQLKIENVGVAEVIEEVAGTVEGLARQSGNRLVLELPGEEMTVRCDRGKFVQSLLNLAGNACKFTDNGVISMGASVAFRAGQEWAEIHVRDTGIGIAPEAHGTLFDAFVQVDASQTRKHGGTGLGLAISRKSCRLMGGDITVTSELKRGSVFTITLPCSENEPTDGVVPVEEQKDGLCAEENRK